MGPTAFELLGSSSQSVALHTTFILTSSSVTGFAVAPLFNQGKHNVTKFGYTVLIEMMMIFSNSNLVGNVK